MVELSTLERVGSRDRSRIAVIRLLAGLAEDFPDLHPGSGAVSEGVSSGTGHALRQGVVRRWLTLEALLEPVCSKPLFKLEPLMRALLLAGAFELVFQDGTPRPAVVMAYVDIAKKLIRPGAAGLANAVLRKVSAWREQAEVVDEAVLSARHVPIGRGKALLSPWPVLPEPTEDAVGHASAAFSLRRDLVHRWRKHHGDVVERLLWQSLEIPPTIVAVPGGEAEGREWMTPHRLGGFVVWTGAMSALGSVLSEHPGWRVQDPAAAKAVAGTSDLNPRRVLDLCAGRGTKSLQALGVHPGAEVWAYEPHQQRRESLMTLAAKRDRLRVVDDRALEGQRFDLVLADVPCSNTAVLARRLEARYRFTQKTVEDLRGLQQRLLLRALDLCQPGGAVVYSTCSLEPEENEVLIQRVVRKRAVSIVSQALTLPEGSGATYQDGGFHARLVLAG
ncbi:MAG: transcription antitermination factor NusB [Phycisphaeraceae bacterium]